MFILHAEHEMNCSTAAVRHLASSGGDVYTAVAGAVGALYGPLHGGANEAVLRMLARIGSRFTLQPLSSCPSRPLALSILVSLPHAPPRTIQILHPAAHPAMRPPSPLLPPSHGSSGSSSFSPLHLQHPHQQRHPHWQGGSGGGGGGGGYGTQPRHGGGNYQAVYNHPVTNNGNSHQPHDHAAVHHMTGNGGSGSATVGGVGLHAVSAPNSFVGQNGHNGHNGHGGLAVHPAMGGHPSGSLGGQGHGYGRHAEHGRGGAQQQPLGLAGGGMLQQQQQAQQGQQQRPGGSLLTSLLRPPGSHGR
ncbi:Citrate synthase 3, peroxisomal [Tetrabaena socialis]|uniref:Citrate synthase 3, peroxisomal n=1 Tax=Tetrabaena socialis TaxID=47790 RepID=A0A2J7ZR06_9CHLO|nr:Citrate synthase 3, peroxisomal [Tetrabaena socialis]|eukprot:PNH02699.1 Citrate synthase 3, peroxisomal [Tetrabaena socialis]